ncbi:hypothetical protein [Burkholderia contaminans]|uniref:hypothetical protein n=1 Tax=Burkholderia contaminans TaxID=488447 RepID=UPI0015884237|nr:hypothetical protein [Burkholderia contaminans]
MSARLRLYYRDSDWKTTVIERIVEAKNKKLLEIELRRVRKEEDQNYYSYMVDNYKKE